MGHGKELQQRGSCRKALELFVQCLELLVKGLAKLRKASYILRIIDKRLNIKLS